MQQLGIDFEKTYLLVVDATTFCYLISLIVHERLNLCLMDVVIANLYGSLDNDIYMKLSKRLNLPKAYNSSSWEQYPIKLNKSHYGLKQSRHMW